MTEKDNCISSKYSSGAQDTILSPSVRDWGTALNHKEGNNFRLRILGLNPNPGSLLIEYNFITQSLGLTNTLLYKS